MKYDKAEIWFVENGKLDKVTLWHVTEDEDGNITGTLVLGDFPGCEEVVTLPACCIDALYGEVFV